jgi:hypothetical protein
MIIVCSHTYYSGKINSPSYEKELPVLWNRMPAELRETLPKRLATGNSKVTLNAKKKKVEDPDKIFAKLEKKERNESEGDGNGGLLSKVYSNFHKFIKCFNDRWERR